MSYSINPSLKNAKIIDLPLQQSDYGSYYTIDQQHPTFTLKADDGYVFSKDGTIQYDKDGLGNMQDLIIPANNANTLTYTITLPKGVNWSDQSSFMLYMDAQPAPTTTQPTQPTTPVATPIKKCTLRPHLTNATIVDPPQQSDDLGSPVYYIDQQHPTFTLKADSGFTFTTDGTLRYNIDDLGSTDNLKVPANNASTLTYTITLPEGVKWENQDIFDLSMDATQTQQPTAPTQTTTPTTTTNQCLLTANLQNAKIIDPKPTLDSHGKTQYYVNQQHPIITLEANDGYIFSGDGSLSYIKDDLGDGGTLPIKATNTNTVTVKLPSNIQWTNQEFTIDMGATIATIVKGTGGFINIYKADYASLLKISNDVTIKMNGDQTLLYDYSQYINNLIILPFNVPTGEKAPVVAGTLTLSTQLPTVDNNYLTIDLGSITVPEQYQNGYDYYQVKSRLMLPYTDMIELDTSHVINKTVSIKYVINVVNGDTTINLYNGDDLFLSQQVNLASEIPFMANTNTSQYVVINQLKTMFRNDIKQAYIIIEQPTPILNSDYYPTNEKGTLQGYKGNVKASLLNNLSINENDLNELQNLLQTGVKIK